MAALAPLAVWILVPYLVFSLAATKMIAYVFTAAPALLLVTARFWTGGSPCTRARRAGGACARRSSPCCCSCLWLRRWRG